MASFFKSKYSSTALILFAVFVVGCFALQEPLLKLALQIGAEKLTGFQVKIVKVKYQFPDRLSVYGLRILNPPNYERPVFVDVPQAEIKADLMEMWDKKIVHFKELNLSFLEINIEKDSHGMANVALLRPVRQKIAAPGDPKRLPFFIDHMELTLRRVSYIDKSVGEPKTFSEEMTMERRTFTFIEGQDLLPIILSKIVSDTTFGPMLQPILPLVQFSSSTPDSVTPAAGGTAAPISALPAS